MDSEIFEQKVKKLLIDLGIDLKGININTFCEALTHTTFSNEHKNVQNFEYLEFLGDAIIEFVVTAEIYKRFPNYNEGMATQHRISIVNNHTLSTISRKLKIIDNIRTGNKAFINGQNEKVDSDFFEAFIAALYVEKGLDFATKFLLKNLEEYFHKVDFKKITDPKTAIQELLQSTGIVNIKYKCDKKSNLGLDKDKIELFECKLFVDDVNYGTGIGKTKKEAEKNAALDALHKQTNIQEN